MEKSIQITIGSTQFQLTESAYEKLNAYLESLKAHFASQADSAEIMRDIEARIAEKLLEDKAAVVALSDIERIVKEIGIASEFESEEDGAKTEAGPKKLYRDIDNAMIAGVAAGIAHYFGIDALWVRLIFLASVFFGGTGIILYLVLLLLIPAAKTASQKLEMHGSAVTLEAITRVVRERVEEAKERGAFERLVLATKQFIVALFKILGKIVGSFIAVGAFLGMLGATFAVAILVANWDTAYVSEIIREIVSPGMLTLALAAAYLSAVIPLILILALGARLVRGRGALPSAIGFGLVGLWCLAIPVTGALTTRIVGDYYTLVETHPTYKEISETLDLGAFDSVIVEDARLTIREGSEQSVEVSGTEESITFVSAAIEGGTLSLTTDTPEDTCVIFCRRIRPSILITTPDLDSVIIKNGYVWIDDLAAADLDIDAAQSSVRGSIEVERLTIEAESSSVSLNAESTLITVDALSSSVDIDGKAAHADFTLVRSDLGATSLILESASMHALRSSARVFVDDEFIVEEDEASYVHNEGRAALTR